MSNLQPGKPPTTITILDPKTQAAIEAVKKDTEAILEQIKADRPAPADPPRYFPRGYFP